MTLIYEKKSIPPAYIFYILFIKFLISKCLKKVIYQNKLYSTIVGI